MTPIMHLRKRNHRYVTTCGILSHHTTDRPESMTCLNCLRAHKEARSKLRADYLRIHEWDRSEHRLWLAENVGKVVNVIGMVRKGSRRGGDSSVLMEDVFDEDTGAYTADHVWAQYCPHVLVTLAKCGRIKGSVVQLQGRIIRYTHRDGTIGYTLGHIHNRIDSRPESIQDFEDRVNRYMRSIQIVPAMLKREEAIPYLMAG